MKRTRLSPRTEQVCPAGLSAPPGGPRLLTTGEWRKSRRVQISPWWAHKLIGPMNSRNPLYNLSHLVGSVLTSRLLVRPCGPLLFLGSGTALPGLHKRQPELLASAFSVSRRSPLASGFPLLCSVPGLSYRICAQGTAVALMSPSSISTRGTVPRAQALKNKEIWKTTTRNLSTPK